MRRSTKPKLTWLRPSRHDARQGTCSSAPDVTRARSAALGAKSAGRPEPMIHAGPGGAFVVEAVLTFLYVFVILAVTRRASNAAVAGLVIGLSLTLVHLIGI